jgi:hypothetical protein
MHIGELVLSCTTHPSAIYASSWHLSSMYVSPSAHPQISGVAAQRRAVAQAIVDANYPHALAPAKELRVAVLVQEQVDKVEPSFEYFENTIMTGMADMLAILKAFRLFDPFRIDGLGGDVNAAETQLKLIPFLDDNDVAALP